MPRQKSADGNRVGDYLGTAVLRRERRGTPGRAAGQSKRIEMGRDEGARKVADELRRGWVPLRVLA